MRLFIDLTCSWEEAGRIAHGTLRVERGLAQAFVAMKRDDIAFVRYDRVANRFQALGHHTVLAMLCTPAHAERRRAGRPAWREAGPFALGRAVEKCVRDRIRAPLRRWLRTQFARGARGPADEVFAPGDTLFLPGELRHDQRSLVALRARGVRLAMLFYDLLKTLPDGDSRLLDPRAADLPSSDFMAHFSDLTFAISQHSATIFSEFLKHRRLPPRRAVVIQLASDLDRARLHASEGLTSGDFILCVGDVHPRKNHQMLVDVWRDALLSGIRFPILVIVGRVDAPGTRLVRDVRSDSDLASRIIFKSNVEDAELAWLYTYCRFAVFPSLDEGFGLPVAEALGFGRVCVASSSGAIPEAGQGFAVVLDPRDKARWLKAIALLSIDDAELLHHEQRIRNGFRRSTWDGAARTIVAAATNI